MSGLSRQPPQAKFSGNRDKDHPWRHPKLGLTEKEKAARLRDRCRPTAPVGRSKYTLYGSSTAAKMTRESFVCVSCGDPDCVGGECAARWGR